MISNDSYYVSYRLSTAQPAKLVEQINIRKIEYIIYTITYTKHQWRMKGF